MNRVKTSMVWVMVTVAVLSAETQEPAVAGAAAVAQDGGWELRVTPYVWAPSLSGDVGLKGASADVDLPISDLLQDLEMAGMLGMEVRKDRLGLLADGVYYRFTTEADTPGNFLKTIDTTIKFGMLDLAVAYRVVDVDRGWLDLLAGGRYMTVEVNLDLIPNYAAADSISGSVMDRTVESLQEQMELKADEIADKLADITEGLGQAAHDKISEALKDRAEQRADEIMGKIESIPPRQLESLKEALQEKLDSITDEQREALAEAVKEALDNRADEISGNVEAIREEIRNVAETLKLGASEEVKKKLEAAEKDLAAAIKKAMQAADRADPEGDRQWVDPYVGVRGRLNLTDAVYAAGRADIGGFGVGSDVAWQLFGGVGVQMTERVDLEAGWRHLAFDYDKDDVRLDLALSGFVASVTIAF